jgi:hypothetical protein
MRTLLVALLFGTSLLAQSPSFFITDPSGSNIIGPLPSVYQFADTPEAGSNSLVLRVTNPSTVPIEIVSNLHCRYQLHSDWHDTEGVITSILEL